VVVTAAIYTAARLGLADRLTDDIRRITGRDPLTVEETARRKQAAWHADPWWWTTQTPRLGA
jgi:hypothetical protein